MSGFGSWLPPPPIAVGPPIIRRKVFVSFHHADEPYRKAWEQLTSGVFINKSVHSGDIDTDNSAEYIARLIRQDFVSDASVLVVLVGPKAYCRKHVDWEVAAGLNPVVGGARAGLVGILLPHHPNFGPGKLCDRSIIPGRLVDNVDSKYALLYDWSTDREHLRKIVNHAYDTRVSLAANARNGRAQMAWNTCD
jgi:antiphage defense system Thoeris ThsB-like protein